MKFHMSTASILKLILFFSPELACAFALAAYIHTSPTPYTKVFAKLLLEVYHYSSSHFPFRHLLEDFCQIFHLLCSKMRLYDTARGHIEDLLVSVGGSGGDEAPYFHCFTLVSHCRPLNIMLHCNL